jgi:hypothetical protein
MSKYVTTASKRVVVTAASIVCALAAIAYETAAASPSPPVASVAADWTAVSANTATGTLLGARLSLSGTHVWGPPQSTLDGSWTYFASSVFSPSLASSDAIQISGGPDRPFAYDLDFGGPVTDPILEVGSLASRIEFPPGTKVTRLSGDDDFVVSGAAVSGQLSSVRPSGLSDSSGTIKLTGTFAKIGFTAKTTYTGSAEDGIVVQLGAVARRGQP